MIHSSLGKAVPSMMKMLLMSNLVHRVSLTDLLVRRLLARSSVPRSIPHHHKILDAHPRSHRLHDWIDDRYLQLEMVEYCSTVVLDWFDSVPYLGFVDRTEYLRRVPSPLLP